MMTTIDAGDAGGSTIDTCSSMPLVPCSLDSPCPQHHTCNGLPRSLVSGKRRHPETWFALQCAAAPPPASFPALAVEAQLNLASGVVTITDNIRSLSDMV
jgi:hypothetical protein